MLLLILVLLLALSTILVGAPSWKNPPVGVGMALTAIVAVVCIYQMLVGFGHR